MGCQRSRVGFTFMVITMVLFGYMDSTVLGKMRVRIQNRLEPAKPMAIHCQSRDDDLGNLVVESGYEIEWRFNVNFWGSTLFYCDVQWDGATWHHFDAFSAARDTDRCLSECMWMVSSNEDLFVYDQNLHKWDWVLF